MSLAVARTKVEGIGPDFCQCLRHSVASILSPSSLALIHNTVRLAALKTHSDWALFAMANSTSIAITDNAKYDCLCDGWNH